MVNLNIDKSCIEIIGYPRDIRPLLSNPWDLVTDVCEATNGRKKRFRPSNNRRDHLRFEIGGRILCPASTIDIFYSRDFSKRTRDKTYMQIRFTCDDRLNYRGHHKAMRAVDMVLKRYGLPRRVYETELALDTLDESIGSRLRMSVLLKHWNPRNRLQIFEDSISGHRYNELGCNAGGNNQYYNFKKDARQVHAYEKEFKGQIIYRLETILRRQYMRKKSFQTHTRLMAQAEELLRENIVFKVPNIDRLRRFHEKSRRKGKHPRFTKESFETWEKMTRYPIAEWDYELNQKIDLKRAEITRMAFDLLPFPAVKLLY